MLDQVFLAKEFLFSFKGIAKCLFCENKSLQIHFFYLNRRILPKENKKKLVKKKSQIRKFGISENLAKTC